ncbi:MAG: hypothetical protein AAF633_03630, partial [Chloroflexota bacterium]
AVLLLPLDVGIRRVVITRSDWERAYAATLGRFASRPAPEPARTEQMSSLMRAKERAKQEKRGAGFTLRNDRMTSKPMTDNSAAEQKEPPPIVRPDPGSAGPKAEEPQKDTPASGSLAARLLKKKQEREGKE